MHTPLRQTLKCSVLSVTTTEAPAPSPPMQQAPKETKPMGFPEIKHYPRDKVPQLRTWERKISLLSHSKLHPPPWIFSLLVYEVIFYSTQDAEFLMKNDLNITPWNAVWEFYPVFICKQRRNTYFPSNHDVYLAVKQQPPTTSGPNMFPVPTLWSPIATNLEG